MVADQPCSDSLFRSRGSVPGPEALRCASRPGRREGQAWPQRARWRGLTVGPGICSLLPLGSSRTNPQSATWRSSSHSGTKPVNPGAPPGWFWGRKGIFRIQNAVAFSFKKMLLSCSACSFMQNEMGGCPPRPGWSGLGRYLCPRRSRPGWAQQRACGISPPLPQGSPGTAPGPPAQDPTPCCSLTTHLPATVPRLRPSPGGERVHFDLRVM